MDTRKRRTWAEIDLRALEHNYMALRGLLEEGCKLLCPVKADGYGHGAVPVALHLEALGADYLAVACLDEGVELRQAGVKAPILILGHTDPAWAAELAGYHLTQTVFDPLTAQSLSETAQRLGQTIKVHLKADTGMTRLGLLCDEEDLEETVETVVSMTRLPGLCWEGIFTHFANADTDEEYTMLQLTRFLDLLDALDRRGVRFPLRHCGASSATLQYPSTHLDMVRPGIALYGHLPDPSCEGLVEEGLRPMMTLKTRVASVKNVPEGTAVSYGCTFVTRRPSRLAVLNIGYADGLPRSCSNGLKVWLGEGYAPVVGRICMDQCMVDATDLPSVRPGDVAELYGPHTPVEEAARQAGTISYELLSTVGRRVPRVYLTGTEGAGQA